jgi:hypothetical protein
MVSMGLALSLAACGSGVNNEWVDRDGTAIPADLLWSVQGPADHCAWSSAAFLFVGREGNVRGIPSDWNDQYVRDPEGLFEGRLAAAFDPDAEPPAEVAETGYSNGALELWLASDDPLALYLRTDDGFERWPRVEGDEPILCT